MIKIEGNKKLINDNKKNIISQPIFKNDYNKILEYEYMDKTLEEYGKNKISKQNEIKTKEKKIEDIKKIINLSIDQIKTLNNNDLYRYETINKITEKDLKANNLLKGKGILFLSQKEIEYVLYKMKDSLLYTNDYIIKAFKKPKNEKKENEMKMVMQTPPIEMFLKPIMDIINPIIENILTADIKNDIRFVDSIKIANILYKIFDIGLKNIQANDALYLINTIKRFYKEFDNEIKLLDRDIINIYNVLKKGFNSLTKLNKKSILNKVIELIDLPDGIKKIAMKVVKINSETNVANNN